MFSAPRRHLRESATPNVIQAAGYPRLAAILCSVIHCAECRSTKATLTGGRFFSCTSRELVNPSDMWQRSPCMKAPSGQGALRGHYVKQKQKPELIAVETSRCWTWQTHELSAKKYSKQGVEPDQEKGIYSRQCSGTWSYGS